MSFPTINDNLHKSFNFTVVRTASLYGNIMYITIECIARVLTSHSISHHPILYVNLLLFHTPNYPQYDVTVITDM